MTFFNTYHYLEEVNREFSVSFGTGLVDLVRGTTFFAEV